MTTSSRLRPAPGAPHSPGRWAGLRSLARPARPFLDRSRLGYPEYQAFLLLRTVFTVAPVAFGLDKFLGWLTDWPQYLAPAVNDLVPGDAHQAMLMVGVVEVLAGLVVALRPDVGGWLVAAWLAGIIGNLLLIPGFYDVALRDFGLLVAAVALARLAAAVYADSVEAPRPAPRS
jgi:hypothetical protein